MVEGHTSGNGPPTLGKQHCSRIVPEELSVSADTHASRDAHAAAEINLFISGGLGRVYSKAEMFY